MGKAFDENTARLAIVGDDPMLLADEDPEKVGRANKANSIAYTPARERITRLRHQLEHHRLAGNGLGDAGLSRPDSGRSSRQAPPPPPPPPPPPKPSSLLRGSTMTMPVARLGGTQFHAQAAFRLAQWPELPRAAFFRSRHRPDRRPGRRARVDGRRFDGQERHHLQPQHPDRRSLHHAACGPDRRPCVVYQAAVATRAA